jgi:hypothetical protein
MTADVTPAVLRGGMPDMSILSRIDWRAVASELPEVFEPPTVRSLEILRVLGKRELIGVDVEDLGRGGDDDPELFTVLGRSLVA